MVELKELSGDDCDCDDLLKPLADKFIDNKKISSLNRIKCVNSLSPTLSAEINLLGVRRFPANKKLAVIKSNRLSG
jgi:hypothetical protein